MGQRKERMKFGMMIFMVILMVGTTFSVIFYGFSNFSDTATYNKIKFSTDGTKWTAKINGKYVSFNFLPNELEYINSSNEIAQLLQNKIEVDSTSDFNATSREFIALAQHEMSLALSNQNLYFRRGFTNSTPYQMPVINCTDSTEKVPVIYFREGNSTRIYADGSCIIAEASGDNDFLRVKDRILYIILGVMK